MQAEPSAVAPPHTDLGRWTDRESYLPFWDARATAVAPLLAGRGWVCDIGCGAQALRSRVAAGVRYLPADLRAWTEDTETCALNAVLRCDVAVMLGVLEYIVDPAALLARLSHYAEHLLLTYSAPELWAVDRAGFGWVNALGRQPLITMLAANGYHVTATSVFEDRQLVIQAATRFGALQRLRRSAARQLLKRPA